MSNDMLKGIRVVELSTHVAVPYCGRALADLGAEVIKIEPPKGEPYRGKMGMLFEVPNKPGADYMFTPYNANKKSLCLNLKDPDSHEAFMKLMETTDIFLSNTREKALEKLGISFESLVEKFPRLICGSVNGYGTTGPKKDLPGYDATTFWAGSGALTEFSYKEDNYQFKPFYGFGDSVAAAQLTTGVLAALYNRQRTGKGDVVRVSLLATGLWCNAGGMMRAAAGHKFPKSFLEPIMPLDNFYKTKDGKWFLSSEEKWDQRCGAYFDLFGMPELKNDPNWNNTRAYINPKNRAVMVKFFEEHFAQVTSEEITEALSKVDGVFCFLPDHDEILTDEQAWDNNFLRKMHTKDGTELTISNVPYQFRNEGVIDEIKPAPQLGEDSEAILKELGYSEDKIKEMADHKAIVVYSE